MPQSDEGPLDALANLFGFKGVTDVPAANENEPKGKKSDERRPEERTERPADISTIFKQPKSKRVGADSTATAKAKARPATGKQDTSADDAAGDESDTDSDTDSEDTAN